MAKFAAALPLIVGAGGGTLATIGSVVGLGTSLIGAVQQFQGAKLQEDSLKLQARQADLSARQEELRGKQQANLIAKERDAQLASANAMFASRGILVGSGTPAQARALSQTEASREIELARFGSAQAADSKRISGISLRNEASATKLEGRTKALSTAVGGFKQFGGTLLDRL